MIERRGFIGAGAITEAIVTGLAAAPHGLRVQFAVDQTPNGQWIGLL